MTISEFKAWIEGFEIGRGGGGHAPSTNEWNLIKKNLSTVDDEKTAPKDNASPQYMGVYRVPEPIVTGNGDAPSFDLTNKGVATTEPADKKETT